MFIEERQQKILDILRSKNRVEVQELSSYFNVSEDTIRRDLRFMERRGEVHRTYGGAIIPGKVSATEEFVSREKLQPEKKEDIARIAAAFIEENDTILLDGSTTVARLVPFLKSFSRLTVITNSIVIAYEVARLQSGIKLFVIGGQVRHDISNAISTESLQQIQSLYTDKVFIGACSFSAKHGLTTPVLEEASIKKAMLEAGREIYIMADSSKLGQRTLAHFGSLKPGYTIITDDGFSQELKTELKVLQKRGLKVIIAKHEK